MLLFLKNKINENEGGCQTLVSAPLSTNQLIASGGQHLSSTSIHDPNHFHSSSSASSSANSSIAQISNHYPRSQHSLNHNHSQTHAHDSVVNGFLNNILPTDPLPQFSILQEQSRNLYNSNNLVCNTNSTNEPSSVLFETSVLQFGSINDTNINGINNLSNKELISK